MSSAGARFRNRKISLKQSLQVFKQNELPELEIEDQQRELEHFDTGVEKGEEEEHHLQQVIIANQAAVAGNQVKQIYIPTPDASQKWAEASKYYAKDFKEPSNYICFSSTVEDTCRPFYCLDEVDEEFVKKLNASSKEAISESEFESIAEAFEKIIEKKQPFLTMDPESILGFKELKSICMNSYESLHSDLSKELDFEPFRTLFDKAENSNMRELPVLLDTYGEEVYKHWRERKIQRRGKPVFPTLKFESPTQKDDNDTYICFRRREVRQARKTRRQDTQSSDRIRLLYSELKRARELVYMCAEREARRMKFVETEKRVFDLRCHVKSLKRELGVKGEEEDLVSPKRKKIVPIIPDVKLEPRDRVLSAVKRSGGGSSVSAPSGTSAAAIKRTPANSSSTQLYVRLPSSRIPDLDMTTVSAVLKEKDKAISAAVTEKLRQRAKMDQGWVNLTEDCFNPLFKINMPEDHILDSSHVPYSSIASSLYEVEKSNYITAKLSETLRKHAPLPNVVTLKNSNGETVTTPSVSTYAAGCKGNVDVSQPIVKFRKRVGRRGVWIDRKPTHAPLDSYLNFSSDSEPETHLNVYDCREDRNKRLASRFSFDQDIERYEPIDPSRLNQISAQTQSIRFGSMLLTKSYEHLQHARQKYLLGQHEALQQKSVSEGNGLRVPLSSSMSTPSATSNVLKH